MLGPVTMLVNCAGYAVAQKFEDTEIGDFKVSIFVYQFSGRCIVNLVALKQLSHCRSYIFNDFYTETDGCKLHWKCVCDKSCDS